MPHNIYIQYIYVYIKQQTFFRLSTDIYYKTTDTHQYLDFISHPRHPRINIPYNLARRLWTIVDDEKVRDARLKELQLILLKRNYPKELVHTSISKAKTLNQLELRTVQPKQTTDNSVTLVTTFNPKNPIINPLIEIGLTVLKNSSRLKLALQGISFVYRTRQPANLKQILTRSKFSDKVEGIVSKCRDKRCITCKQLMVGKMFTFKSTNQEFKIKKSMNCNARFLSYMYVLTCKVCGEDYIEEIKLRLRERMTLHRQ